MLSLQAAEVVSFGIFVEFRVAMFTWFQEVFGKCMEPKC